MLRLEDSKHKVTKSSADRVRTPLGSRDANRVAAAILEVLAGVRTPTDAAQALVVSVPRYYQLEQRALEGLIAACEPRRLGRVQTSESRVSALEREVQRWQLECARQQALVRASAEDDWLGRTDREGGRQDARQKNPQAAANGPGGREA